MAGRRRAGTAASGRARLPLPKYFLVQNILRDRLREYRAGQQLPSETVLTRQFRVSRVTLQRALGGLVRERLIVRRQGKGTYYVGRDREKGTQQLSGVLESLMVYEDGGRAQIIGKSKWVQPPADVAKRLGLAPTDGVVVVKRVAFSRSEPLAYIVNYLPYDYGIKIFDDDQELERNTMIALLRDKYGIRLSRAVQTIEAELADAEIAERLAVPIGTPVLGAERVYFARGNRPVQFTRSWYRADRYKYTVTLRGWERARRPCVERRVGR